MNFLFAHIPLISVHDSKTGRRRRPTLGTHMSDIVSWTSTDGLTPFTIASRNDQWHVVERLNMALLLEQVPSMPEHKLVLEMEVHGVKIIGGSVEAGRHHFMEYLRSSFGMASNPLPLF